MSEVPLYLAATPAYSAMAVGACERDSFTFCVLCSVDCLLLGVQVAGVRKPNTEAPPRIRQWPWAPAKGFLMSEVPLYLAVSYERGTPVLGRHPRVFGNDLRSESV